MSIAQAWSILLVGLAAVAGSTLLALTSDHLIRPQLQALLSGWITMTFLASGLVAWRRRPASQFGPLLLGAGSVWVLSTLQWSDQPVAYSFGHLLDMLPPAVFLHVFLAYPTGRLDRSPERSLVVACYAVTFALQLVKVLLGVDPANVLAVADLPAASSWVERIQLVSVGSLLVAGALLLLVRRRAAVRRDRGRRRAAALLVDTFGLALVMLAALFGFGLFGGPPFEAFRHLTFVALGLAPVAFLIGLLDARLARADIGGFLVELRADPTQDLAPPLARAMHDPSLQVAYWLPEYDDWADKDGRPVSLPDAASGRAVRVIRRDGTALAALVFDPSLEDERELLDAIEAAAGIALESARLRAELKARLQELQGSRARVLEAGRRERQRLERDLHDGAQQRLVGLSIELGLLGRGEETDPETRRRLARLKEELATSLEELRDVARGLHPAVLTGHGLPVALESLAARASVAVELDVDPRLGRLPEPAEVTAFYVVSESLTNIDKHAHARSAFVRLSLEDDQLVVETEDDGRGGADTERGSGLRGLADRVEALGGSLRVWSPDGSGTRLRAEIPCG